MKLLLTTTLFFLSTCAFAQEAWTDHSATARNKAYVGVGMDGQKAKDKGSVFSVEAEYGRILQKYATLGVSGRVMWLATADAGMAFSIHPYLRVNTSFPHPLPNLFVEIGYDIRRRAFDNADAKPAYFQDFGLRPGLDISLSERVHLFFRFSFSGYQWSLADGVESHSWTLFRHDFTDRTVGVFFYF